MTSTHPDPELVVACRCVDSRSLPLVGLTIEAYDQDPRSPDDKLGTTQLTDPNGNAVFRFHRSDFTEHPGERNPDVYFKIALAGNPYSYVLPGERNDRGVLRNFTPRPNPVIIQVPDLRGYIVRGAILAKWLSLGAHTGLLGRPASDETQTPGGGGFFNHFDGGSIYWTERWGAFEVHGLIRQKWADLSWEQGFLGFPVTDELDIPDGSGGRYNVFEHGIVTWHPGQTEAVAEAHHYERIYAQVRAQIIGRFFAIGHEGRRNHLVVRNRLQASRLEDVDRWNIVESYGENPLMDGALLHTALAIELDAGNAESARVLSAAQQTLDSLFSWNENGANSEARLPTRWDAGLPIYNENEPDVRGDQFLDVGDGVYANSLPASHWYHHPRRDPELLTRWLGPTEAQAYSDRQYRYWTRYRRWELSMDELTGLVASCWIISKLAGNDQDISNTARRQATWLGNYLADNGYLLVRPMGGLTWRGATGLLPVLEHPFSRALQFAAGGTAFGSRTNFRGAMERAGYWPLLEGPIAASQVIGWISLPVALSLLGPVISTALGAVPPLTLDLTSLVSRLGILPSTIFSALAVMQNASIFDIKEQDETPAALLFRDVLDKALAYSTLTTGQAAFATYDKWSVNFHSWIGLTGIDDADTTVRDTFAEWFQIRQAHPELEPEGIGSRTLFAHGIAALAFNDDASDARLVAMLERVIVELFRDSYFAPQLPIVIDGGGNLNEVCGHSSETSSHSPLDLLAGLALAFWHAKRRIQDGNPVTTSRFPAPLAANRFGFWPKITDAAGLELFGLPLVPRRPVPIPIHAWGPATQTICDIRIPIGAASPGDVPTGITLYPGCEIQIDASGQIWGGGLLDPSNGPEGLTRLVADKNWPLHVGLDPAAKAFCLLGRLNGYFRIGNGMVRSPWNYHEPRKLFLRINDDRPGDGNGQFEVRIRVWAPENRPASDVFQPVNFLRDGDVLRTSDAADLIEVTVEEGAVPNDRVEFVLQTPATVTWRKEIVIRENATDPGVTIATHDEIHVAANGLYLYQLASATLTFRKDKGFFGGGVQNVATLNGLNEINPGARLTFKWVHD
ncbi:LGFP repeat-containing protein (plasmid) [Methylomonas sp. MED-D]|uniref:LGFP repeat-containing protein n=1 Tax=Methylomonas sp. MED-D TaxID=3418768 RepID=UPI003D083114